MMLTVRLCRALCLTLILCLVAVSAAMAQGDVPGTAPEAPGTEVTATETGAFADQIREAYGQECEIEKNCSGMFLVDCNSEVDGPIWYLEEETLDVVAECGGACLNPDHPCHCPPAEWNCEGQE